MTTIEDLIQRVEALEKWKAEMIKQQSKARLRGEEFIDSFFADAEEMRREHKEMRERVQERLRNGARFSGESR